VLVEPRVQLVLDERAHPVERLTLALRRKRPAARHRVAKALALAPELVDALDLQGAHAHHRRRPARLVRPQHRQRVRDLRARELGRPPVDVGLVHRYDVHELHDPAFDRLQVVARVRQRDQDEAVGHAGDRGLRLPDADRLDDHDVEASRLAHEHRLAGHVGHAAEHAARRRGPDERVRVSRQPLHPRLVAENRAAG